MFRTIFIFLNMWLVTSTAFADVAINWIIGSYVNVRSQPSRNAEIVNHLVVNTPVKLLSKQDDFCEITWGENQRGFVACNLLGDKALRIEDVGAKPKYNEKTNPQYSPQRAFWIEPTIERLFDAGEYFRVTMLPADQLSAEDDIAGHSISDAPPPELKRFPLPEFDAMKKLMADGLIAPRNQYSSLLAWKKIQNEYSQTIAMPKAKPSFFKPTDEIGRPSADAEILSAQYQIPHSTTVVEMQAWVEDHSDGVVYKLAGAWDIGRVVSRLTQPIYEVAVGINGEIAVGKTVVETKSHRYEDRCDGSFELGTSNKLLPGYEQIKQPWIFFRLATLPALTKAKVIINKLTNNVDKMDGGGVIGSSMLLRGNETTARIDLDADGVDDLFVWDDGGNGIDDLSYRRERLIFANIAGQWYLLDTDVERACGC